MTAPSRRSKIDRAIREALLSKGIRLHDSVIETLVGAVSEAEQEAYRRCQESVIEARRSAERIEGQMWIG